jgi:hypothetical protein
VSDVRGTDNTEASTGLCVRDDVVEPPTPESRVKCEAVSMPVTMECFPFWYSPYVTMRRGSSG